MACCGTPTATYLQARSCDTTTALYLLPGMSMRLGLVSRTIWKSLHITCKFNRGRVSAASSRDDVKPPPSPSLQEGLSHCGAHLIWWFKRFKAQRGKLGGNELIPPNFTLNASSVLERLGARTYPDVRASRAARPHNRCLHSVPAAMVAAALL